MRQRLRLGSPVWTETQIAARKPLYGNSFLGRAGIPNEDIPCDITAAGIRGYD